MTPRPEAEPRSRLIPFREVEKAYQNFPLGAYHSLLRNGFAESPELARRYPVAGCYPDFVESEKVDKHLRQIESMFSEEEGGWRNGFEKEQVERVRGELGVLGNLPNQRTT